MAPTRSGARLVAAAAAFLLPVVFSTAVSAQAWSPRVAVLLILGAFGLPRLVALLRTGARPAAVAAIAFIAIAAVATAASRQAILSLFGSYNWGTGLLFVVALVAAWAVGACVDKSGVALVENALIGGVIVNAAVALIQGGFSLGTEPFTRYEGRAAGLLGNPVHLGTLMVGGLALLLPRVRTNTRVWVPATVAVAAALELSGSRFALGLAILVCVVAVARGRSKALAGAGALVLGLLLGVAIGAAGGATTGSGRVQTGNESVGISARIHAWENGGQAVADRPFLGSGPGRFRAATSRYRSLGIVRAEGADRVFADAHNIFVEYATTTGILGVVAFTTWLFLAGRTARGPLLAFALLVLAMHLVEPQSVATTPLAFIAIGVAGRTAVTRVRRVETVATAVLVVLAVVSAGRLLYGDFELRQANLDSNASAASNAVRALPPWPEPAEFAGRIALFHVISTGAADARAETLRWDREATRRDDTDPAAWSVLAEAELYFGDASGARRAFTEALRWDPWSVRALNGLANAAITEGDRAAARAALQRSLTAEPHQKKARAQLRAL